MPERAASILNPKPVDDADELENLGGSTRENRDAVRRRLRIPIRFRVGERPAGADRGEDFEIEVVLSFGPGERTGRMGRMDCGTNLRGLQRSLGDGGAGVRKN